MVEKHQKYQEIEQYREFSIVISIMETTSTWRIEAHIGTYYQNDFTSKFPPIVKDFSKSAGAINSGLQMIEEAKKIIDNSP